VTEHPVGAEPGGAENRGGSLTPEWEEILAAEVSDDETPEEIHASLVHTLGNIDPQRTDD
jgi:hypothetical protein